MSEGLNKVILFGNLCADPELKVTQSGTSILKLRLATNEQYKDRDGAWKDKVEYHSVSLFGKRAEALSNMLRKGEAVLIEGGLHTSSYEDRDGNKRYRTEVNASRVCLTGGGKGGGGQRGERRAPTQDDDGPEDYGRDDFPSDDESSIPF